MLVFLVEVCKVLLELVERGEEAIAGLGRPHRLGHVLLVDDDGGGAVAEVVQRAGGMHGGRRSSQASRSGGTTSVNVANPVAVYADHHGLEPTTGVSSRRCRRRGGHTVGPQNCATPRARSDTATPVPAARGRRADGQAVFVHGFYVWSPPPHPPPPGEVGLQPVHSV